MNYWRVNLFFSFILTFSECTIQGFSAEKFNEKGSISYQEIADLYLSSFDSNNFAKETQQTCVNFEIPAFSDYEKLRIAFGLLDSGKKIIENNDDSIKNALRYTLRDLDIYYSQSKNQKIHFISKLGPTTTVFGEAVRASIIAHPLTDIQFLKARQAFIKELIENERLYNEILVLLTMAKKTESGFFSFWKQEDPLAGDFINKLYWQFLPDYCNKNSLTLECGVRLSNLITAGVFALVPGIIASRHKQIINGISKILSISDPALKSIVLPGAALLAVAYASFLAYRYKMQFDMAKQTKESINFLQTRLIDVARLVEIAQYLQSLAENNKKIKNGLAHFSAFNELLHGKHRDPDFVQLINLLQMTTFKGEASFFSYSGRVLAAYKLMNNHKNSFSSYVEALGELDACVSIATLLKKAACTDVPSYTFVEYYTNEKPYIKLDNFWNIFIDPCQAIRNSLEMVTHRTIILTGSNTGGKSTALKAIMSNILLAQTFGIACASSAIITPFTYLGTSLRISDDIATGSSMFQAQVNRTKLLIDAAKAIKQDQFGFVIIDELFTGTICKQAEQIAMHVVGTLTKCYPSLLGIISTHFLKLAELENTIPNLIINYKMDAFKDENGTIIRPFKLENGISINNLAHDILMNSLEFDQIPNL